MTLLVADTGPLNYLAQVGLVHVLGQLFDEVLVTNSVVDELQDARAPLSVRAWIAHPPDWVRLVDDPVIDIHPSSKLSSTDASSIVLASRMDAMLLMDEREGRRIAKQQGVVTIGTLGILRAASDRGWINFEEALMRLQGTTIRLSPAIIAQASRRDAP